ncbi:hypothetical protein PTSG_01761 [Salpingoeca rosetta]|uniref:dolichyl-phosphate-mannose--protein mannosyltransferase n=1 Tax=Salpingoeca rosetta (strain ATCC 50818 / BSB-021) TaxID=946362 RepID=F2TYW1_SALR5|nr:uncharacterized protein PTSG_01761 [Salpingoeca rosetta]EGD78785.1 hypothetical protein PTSG_01761 [Salpingoeca rosetta]|eukprot:XP_004997741.1 hypothetical protein PTSG_01761 [Salpingoeca rosetta]
MAGGRTAAASGGDDAGKAHHQHQPPRASSSSMAAPTSTSSLLLAFACTLVVTAVAYSNSYHGKFVFDDLPAIQQNADVDSSKTSVLDVFNDNFWGERMDAHDAQHESYRPLTTLTFRWGHDIHGMNETGFHITNVAMHTIASCLVVVMTPLVIDAPTTPELVLVGSLFAAHPIHTEAVTGLVGRAELLSAIFFIASFLAYTRASKYVGDIKAAATWVAISVALATAAMLSKEQGVTVVGVCLAYELLVNCNLNPIALLLRARSAKGTKRPGGGRRPKVAVSGPSQQQKKDRSSPWITVSTGAVVRLLLLLVLSAIVMKYRVSLNKVHIKVDEKTNPANHMESFVFRSLTKNLYVTLHAWLLIFPLWLCCDWSAGAVPSVTSASDPRIVYILLFYLALAAVILAALRARSLPKTGDQPLWDNMTLDVHSDTIVVRQNTNADPLSVHLITDKPYIGFCLLLIIGARVLAGNRPLHWRSYAAALLALVVAAYSFRTHTRNEDWKDELSLYRSGLIAAPTNAKLHHNAAYYMSGEEQEHHFREAIRLYPPYVSAYINLGVNLAKAGRIDEAIETYRSGLAMHYKHPIYSTDVGVIHRNLGYAYMRKGNLNAALEQFKACLHVRTDRTRCHQMVQHLEQQIAQQQQQQQQQQQHSGSSKGRGSESRSGGDDGGDSQFREKVEHVGGERLARLRREKSGTMVMFYAPWCNHCRAMHTDYIKAKGRLNSPVVAVDCTQQEELCKDQGVTGYPTLRLLGETRQEDVEYTGNREADDVVAFVIDKTRRNRN